MMICQNNSLWIVPMATPLEVLEPMVAMEPGLKPILPTLKKKSKDTTKWNLATPMRLSMEPAEPKVMDTTWQVV